MRNLILFFCITSAQFLAAQDWQVSGTITDNQDGLPLPGVNIIVKDSPNIGTISDIDGNYSIKVPRGKSVTFTFMGYATQEKAISGNSILNIVLELNATMLQEVVAIGYGTLKKSDLTGSVSSIKGDLLRKTPSSGLDHALQGHVAGVTVNANSGQPGAPAQVRIRGIGTVNDSAPVYVVDGIIVSDISFLNPNDIEQTEILKDASATAIYGSRGANGVILVTTKQGKAGKGNISFNAYMGVQNHWNELDLMERDEFAQTLIYLNNVASEKNYFEKNGFDKWLNAYRVGNSPYYPANLTYSSIETNWQNEVFNSNALIQNYHLSIDGGSENNNYAISAGYFTQEGTIIGSNYQRLTLRVNSSHKVRKWLKIGENLSFSNSSGRNAMVNNENPGASILSAALAMAPWDPAYYPDGSVNKQGVNLSGQPSASSNFRNVTNPISMATMYEPKNIVERWVGDIHIEITPVKELTWRSAVSMDLSNNRNKSFTHAYKYSDFDKADKNFLSSSMFRHHTLIFENTLTFMKSFGKHKLTAMAGQTTEEYNYESMGGAGASILNPSKNNWYLSQTTEDRTYASESALRTRMFSLLGRLHYTYNERYLATLNFRADASSKFPQNLWGYFPSMALAWRLSEEEWMKDLIPNLDHIKIRAGWGRIGNDKINQNSFLLTMFNEGPSFVDYVLGQNQTLAGGATILTYTNKNGKWETTEQWNTGIDFGFFNGLLNGNIDVYRRNTIEMLLSVKAPAHVANRYDPIANVGTVRNDGIELSLEHNNKSGRLNYNIGGNISFVKNELTALNGGDRVYGDKTICDEGYALYTYWGYKYEGIYRSDDEASQHLYATDNVRRAGDAKFTDLNNDGNIDDRDKTDIGNPFPWLTYGLNAGINYLNFDLQLFFQGIYGNKLYNAARMRTEGKGLEATLGTQMRNVWTAASPTGTIPNPYGNSANFETSSRFVEDGAYLRLKNIQIGYSLPKSIINRIAINQCRFYISATNLLTFTKYTGYDPEVGGGVDYGNYPQARTILFGVNLNF
ncbi:MAG: TonB-dependent receptor [Dysgonamonadaceae bacterium]|jgi:TonB-linked SusC/RagA family outer membrane protein|nr:TonB-dependent receptor [Dysgonamonadaceae bacterium]